jgi:hypothetical protein
VRVFESRVLRIIFGQNRDEMTGGWRKLHNEELHNLYSSPSIIKMTKSRTMRWEGHVAGIGTRKAYGIFVGTPRHKLVLIVVVLTIYTEETVFWNVYVLDVYRRFSET